MSFTYLAIQIFPPGAQIGTTICTNDKKKDKNHRDLNNKMSMIKTDAKAQWP